MFKYTHFTFLCCFAKVNQPLRSMNEIYNVPYKGMAYTENKNLRYGSKYDQGFDLIMIKIESSNQF